MKVRVKKHAHVLDLGRVHNEDFGDATVNEPSRRIFGRFFRQWFLLASKSHGVEGL